MQGLLFSLFFWCGVVPRVTDLSTGPGSWNGIEQKVCGWGESTEIVSHGELENHTYIEFTYSNLTANTWS